ncbi:MAG: Uma2 family endonuclease [Leptolyngbyaceae bacterium]|nr:Uma2 family endonuclease [Leptolyngbyaceae bacterium]
MSQSLSPPTTPLDAAEIQQNRGNGKTGQVSPPHPLRFTVADYHRLTALGFLQEDDRVELVRGELIQMAAKGVRHEFCLRRLLRQLPKLLGDGVTLQCQAPVTLAFDGEPEPDFAILRNREDDYATSHPTAADVLWAIEIADSSVEYDQTMKRLLYAEAEIPHYWIFNLMDRRLECYSEPGNVGETMDYCDRRLIASDQSAVLPKLFSDTDQEVRLELHPYFS